MGPVAFGIALTSAVGGAALVGWLTVFLATHEEGFYRGCSWRVYMTTGKLSWSVQVLPPGSGWENVGRVPLSEGRHSAINLALDTIDAR
jgi:hypothetical protein